MMILTTSGYHSRVDFGQFRKISMVSPRGTPRNFFFRIYAKLTKKGSSHDMRRRTSGLVAIVKNPRDPMDAEMRNLPVRISPIRGTDDRKITYSTKKKNLFRVLNSIYTGASTQTFRDLSTPPAAVVY